MDEAISKAVVTGASGFIGQALVAQLRSAGAEVLAVDRQPFPDGRVPSRVLDVARPNSLRGLLGQTTVLFHLAAEADVAGSVARPRANFESTLCGAFETFEAAREVGCRVVFPSTASIFDPGVRNVLPLTEDAFVRPRSPYAAAKVAGEALAFSYHRSYGLDIRIARMFSVYGIGMKRFAIFDLVQKLKARPATLSILGDGNQVRDYLYVDDAARGLTRIATHGTAGEDYHLASGVATTILDLARAIASLLGQPNVPIVPTGESFAGDVPRFHADISKIRNIGFAPTCSLEEGLRRTVAWLTRG